MTVFCSVQLLSSEKFLLGLMRLIYALLFVTYGCRMCVAFLINLASTAKVQSFGRAGLVCLAECISSTACQVRADDNESEAQWSEDAIPGMIQVGNSPRNDKVVLLDALRFVIESSKQHFNPNYRLRGL